MAVTDIEKLIAIEEIKRLKGRYFRAMDTKNWDLFRTIFTEDLDLDTSYAFTPADHKGDPIEPGLKSRAPDASFRIRGVDAFIEMQHQYLDNMSTVHHGHTPEIEILDAENATGIWAMEDKLRWPEGSPMRTMHGYGHYTERYRKVDGAWKIAALKLTRIRIDVES